MTSVQHAGPSPIRGAGSPACELVAAWPIVEPGYSRAERIEQALDELRRYEVNLLDERGEPVSRAEVLLLGEPQWRIMTGSRLAREVPCEAWQQWRGPVLVGRWQAVREAPELEAAPDVDEVAPVDEPEQPPAWLTRRAAVMTTRATSTTGVAA